MGGVDVLVVTALQEEFDAARDVPAVGPRAIPACRFGRSMTRILLPTSTTALDHQRLQAEVASDVGSAGLGLVSAAPG